MRVSMSMIKTRRAEPEPLRGKVREVPRKGASSAKDPSEVRRRGLKPLIRLKILMIMSIISSLKCGVTSISLASHSYPVS